MIKSPFNQLFRNEFLESKSIVATKSIKMCQDLIEKFEIDRKRLKRDQNRSKMIKIVKIDQK